MKKTVMEKLGVSPSLLGFGCMRFPETPEGKIDREKATPMLEAAYDAGVTYFDTAYVYHNGESEAFLGDVLSKKPRSSYFIATKLPVSWIEKEEDVLRIFNEQLLRLKTDHIDFYLLHAVNGNNWKEKILKFNIIEKCVRLKQEGKIRFLGFSFHDKYEIFKSILTYRDWDFCQIQYNYMDIDLQAGDKGYRLTKKLGVPLVVMEPVKGGSLANLPADASRPFRELRPDDSDAKWALRWVANHDNVKVILSGMSTIEQVRENLKTFSEFKPMCNRQKHAVKLVREALRARVKNGCTGCSYCMPCPSGVNIPGIFRTWNNFGIYGNVKDTVNRCNELKSKNTYSDKCVACGRCEKLCPQHINIIESLQTAKNELDSLDQ